MHLAISIEQPEGLAEISRGVESAIPPGTRVSLPIRTPEGCQKVELGRPMLQRAIARCAGFILWPFVVLVLYVLSYGKL